MSPEEIAFIRGCLPQGRTDFAYYKDRYACELLAEHVGSGMAVSELKRSRYAAWLEKPVVRAVLAACGDGVLRATALREYWPGSSLAFTLTLGQWGEGGRWWRCCDQVSRPGRNLVLQVNFGTDHDVEYGRLIKPGDDHPFVYDCHPVHAHRLTMSWARLDIDLDQRCAMIEELQTDWLRNAHIRQCGYEDDGRYFIYGCRVGGDAESIRRYCTEVLAPYRTIWAEATLFAAIWFLHHELGIRDIWYHSDQSGRRFKGFSGRCAPPRSIYEDLPRRFGGERTCAKPPFLWRKLTPHGRRQVRELPMYRL